MTDHYREEREALFGIAAQRFYEASGLNLPHTSKPEIIAGLHAALAVFEKAHTPTDGEQEAARQYADSEYPELYLAPENEGLADVAERAFLAGAGFRRSEVPEPCPQPCGDLSQEDAREGRVCTEHACTCPQGEPSAAQVKAALDAYVGGDFFALYPASVPYWEPNMRAALRAAGGVR